MENKIIDGVTCIWLQYYGYCTAKPAEEFKENEYMKWNGGSSSRVGKRIKETAKMIVIENVYISDKKEKIFQRKLNKKRLVAIGSEKSFY